jgi:hypothetical protein
MRATRLLGTGTERNKGTTILQAKGGISPQLWKRVAELAGSSAFLLYLSDVGSDRLTLTQAAFFMLAATADAAGKPATRSALLQAYPDQFRGSIRNSYRQLLEPSRLYPKALGWLSTEANPNDDREQLLRVSEEGKSVLAGALLALEPMLEKAAKTKVN